MRHSKLYSGLSLLAAAGITGGVFYATGSLSSEHFILELAHSSTILGIITLALISGLNPFLPIPPATFAPLLLESGFSIYTIIGGFVIGTTIADSIGYAIGWFGKTYADSKYPKLTERLHTFLAKHERYTIPVAFLYFSFAPLPNEIILIPLALSNVSFRKLIIPIILGNIVHHTLFVLGYDRLFGVFF